VGWRAQFSQNQAPIPSSVYTSATGRPRSTSSSQAGSFEYA
jgi:hypothetical protein